MKLETLEDLTTTLIVKYGFGDKEKSMQLIYPKDAHRVAIKWIKALKIEKIEVGDGTGVIENPYHQIICFIKYFFNIEEKELK